MVLRHDNGVVTTIIFCILQRRSQGLVFIAILNIAYVRTRILGSNCVTIARCIIRVRII